MSRETLDIIDTGGTLESLFVNERGDLRRDAYGHYVTTLQRGRGCRCNPPCQGYFACRSSHHRGPRATPTCCGAADEEEDATGIAICDRCWVVRERHRRRRERRAS